MALFNALETGEIDRNEFMVYAALTSFQNRKSGEAFPGYEKLTRRCGLTNKPVGRAIRSLERKKWLERRKRFNNTAVYRLKMDSPRLETLQSETSDPSSPRLETPPVRDHVSTNQINRNQIDGNKIDKNTPRVPKGDGENDVALAIYEAYPRKTARDRALKAIRKRLKEGVSAEHLIDRTKAYAAAVQDKERRFIPYPATWYNGGQYDDDPLEWNPDAQKPPDNWRKHLTSACLSLGRNPRHYENDAFEALPEKLRKEITDLCKETDYGDDAGGWGDRRGVGHL